MTPEVKIKSIAVLLTCFNRKDKTLACLKNMYEAYQGVSQQISIQVYLTNDLSTDGTPEAVAREFPEVKILKGTGELYWAGGMRNSWNAALTTGYDAYLLLNDDTNIYPETFVELLQTHKYSLENYHRPGVYIGSTIDSETREISYGGAVFTNKFLGKYYRLDPSGDVPLECELGNANIMLVPKGVVDNIGILSDAYVHGLADFDYTLLAVKNNVPVLISPNVLGTCIDDHNDPYDTFHKLSLRERFKKLYHPVGLDFRSHLQYMRRHFPLRLPIVYFMGWLKVLFPKFYINKFQKPR